MKVHKFTPGHWKIGSGHSYDKKIEIVGPGIWVDNDDVDPKEARANAKLVSVAPEMLEFVEEISEWVCACHSDTEKDWHSPNCVVARARKILKKAL